MKLKREETRDLIIILKEMIKVAPRDLGERFTHVLENKIPYSPPEALDLMWNYTQNIISSVLPKDPKELNEWQKKVLTIWTGKEW